MENCKNCNKEFTKRGIKLHLKKCDQVYLLIKKKDEEQKEKDSKKIKIVFSHEKKLNLGNYLHDDCVKIIYEYLLLIDLNTSYYKLYNEINNISLVCKNFYLNRPNIEYIKNNIKTEMKTKICRSWSTDIYGLTNEELDLLNYNIVLSGWSRTMHLFNIIDVKELAYRKYGTEYDYKKYLMDKENMKSMTKKEKEIIYNQRKIEYNNLFLKYNYENNHQLELEKIYKHYFCYIKKGVPKINTIEEEIIRKSELIEYINKNNINYFETEEVVCYINKIKNYNIDVAINSLKDRMLKEKKYKSLNKPEYDLLAYTFINYNNKDINQLINIINNTELVRKYMDYNKKTSIQLLFNENHIECYIDDIIDRWCYINKDNDLETYDFIKELDYSIQKKIKNYFLHHNKKKISENCNENSKNLFCLCKNIASIKCIDYNCKKCCKNKNCKKHNQFI